MTFTMENHSIPFLSQQIGHCYSWGTWNDLDGTIFQVNPIGLSWTPPMNPKLTLATSHHPLTITWQWGWGEEFLESVQLFKQPYVIYPCFFDGKWGMPVMFSSDSSKCPIASGIHLGFFFQQLGVFFQIRQQLQEFLPWNWVPMALRYEIYLLQEAFKKDVNDPDRARNCKLLLRVGVVWMCQQCQTWKMHLKSAMTWEGDYGLKSKQEMMGWKIVLDIAIWHIKSYL